MGKPILLQNFINWFSYLGQSTEEKSPFYSRIAKTVTNTAKCSRVNNTVELRWLEH